MVYEQELIRLYELQARIREDEYLHAHSRNRAVIRRQIAIFERNKEFLNGAAQVLDWGCRHGSDACLVRMTRGTDVKIYGCDIEPLDYRAFYDFAGLEYTQLTHPHRLPYDDNTFDVVVGGGVLEHVANDSESLKELWRVIRPNGYFIMSFLPNRYSYTEWLNRTLGNTHHPRLYTHREILHMLIHHGFMPVRSGYHQLVPTLSTPNGGIFDARFANRLVETLFGLNSVLERLWPLNRLSANIYAVAQKRLAFL